MTMNIEIIHDNHVVSFAHIDYDSNLYTYYFEIVNGKTSLHSIDQWAKNGKIGNTYKHKELYHHQYKKKILLDNGDYVEPIIPDEILKKLEYYRVGFINSLLSI